MDYNYIIVIFIRAVVLAIHTERMLTLAGHIIARYLVPFLFIASLLLPYYYYYNLKN